MRWRTIWVGALAGALLVSCDADRTRIELDVPASARGRITELWIGVFDAEETLCTDLAFWATGTCGRACSDVPPPLSMEAAVHALRAVPDADGRFGAPELDVSGATRWRVVVVAQVEGEEPLYGCRGVESGADVTVPLYWAWCSARACDRLYHPACEAQVECAPEPLLDPLTPSCRVSSDSVSVWEEDGRACAEPPSSAGPCRAAVFRCAAGALEPEVSGICPRGSEQEMCVTSDGTYLSEMDLDCDGAHPLCDSVACDPSVDERRACGDRTCVGVTLCVDGAYGECIYGDVEACNGDDDDCDGSTDEGEEPLVDCNVGRRSGVPAADACRGGGCVCGDGAACGERSACCDGACVDVSTSAAHCGACGESCGRGGVCVLGSCASDRPDAGAPDAGVADASAPECSDVASCNLTHASADSCTDGACLCGRDRPCRLPEMCCGGACVDVRTDPANCGRCERACDACVRGRCR